MLDPYKMVVVNAVISLLLILGLFIYKYIYPRKKINLLFLIIVVSLLPLISILRKGTYESGDLSLHAKIAMSFYDSLKDGNLIPRWSNTLCSSFGCPFFIFIYPLPYYLIAALHFIGFSFITSLKILIGASFILSGVTMYIWLKEKFGKIPAFVAGIFYLFAPYHLIDMHFRVAIGELLAFALLPFVFLSITKLIKHNEAPRNKLRGIGAKFLRSHQPPFAKATEGFPFAPSLSNQGLRYSAKGNNIKWFFVLSFSFFLLILSHQVISLTSFPFMILYAIILWKKENKKITSLIFYLTPFLYGILLSSFYLLPVLLEAKYTQFYSNIEEVKLSSFLSLIHSPWKYGLLFQGPNGEIAPTIGYPQLIIAIIGIYFFIKNKINTKDKIFFMFFLFSFFILFILMQPIAKPFWDYMPFVKSFQFSYRLLLPASFFISIIAAIVTKKINNKLFTIIICLLAISFTIINWGNRRVIPEINDQYLYNELSAVAPFEASPINPKWVNLNNKWIDKKINQIEIVNGKADIKHISRTPDKHQYIISAKNNITIKENTFYFPGWSLKINNKDYSFNYTDTKYPGVINFNLPKGNYNAELVFKGANIRNIADKITLLFLLLPVFILLVHLIARKK